MVLQVEINFWIRDRKSKKFPWLDPELCPPPGKQLKMPTIVLDLSIGFQPAVRKILYFVEGKLLVIWLGVGWTNRDPYLYLGVIFYVTDVSLLEDEVKLLYFYPFLPISSSFIPVIFHKLLPFHFRIHVYCWVGAVLFFLLFTFILARCVYIWTYKYYVIVVDSVADPGCLSLGSWIRIFSSRIRIKEFKYF